VPRKLKATAGATTALPDSVSQIVAEWNREVPGLNVGAIGIFARASRLNAIVLRYADTWLSPLGLTWENFSVIVTLRRAGRPYTLTPTKLYQISLLTSGAMTTRIDRVAALGLVERLPDPDDRRGVLVKLTPAGKRLADKAIEAHSAALHRLLDVDPERASELNNLLAALLGRIERLPAPRKGAQL
jgi:DNA-binding MarR family transcriptional regulator